MTSGGWASSNRREGLPTNWPALRAMVKERAGGRCQWLLPDGNRCRTDGNECDHIGSNRDHSLANLRWLCAKHHMEDTQRRAQEARRKYAEPLRAPEAHPGRRRRR